MMRKALAYIFILLLVISCSTTRHKLSEINGSSMTARLMLGQERSSTPELERMVEKSRDTLKVRNEDGREMLILKAIADENGEMVAHDVIDAAIVTARFRNVAERHGKVDICFQVIVPEKMQDSRWQLRFDPRMTYLDDTLRLDPVLITGKDYRKAQLRGYQQYEKFLSRIVKDTYRFVNLFLLEVFLERNIPQIFSFKTDSSFVSDEQFASAFGVTESEAIEHYTNSMARNRNERKKSRIDRMYDKYVKVPILSEGLRLDTVMQTIDGDFIYNYTQTIRTRKGLRKVDILMGGEIYEQDRRLYTMPQSDPLTFYISSISSFVDQRERYLTKVIQRRAEANTACYIDFELSKAVIREDYFNNAEELGRIRRNIAELLENRQFDLDSIVVKASASPEGSWKANESLSMRRSRAVADYLAAYMASYRDSLRLSRGFSIGEDGSVIREQETEIPFSAHCIPENWDLLDRLVGKDSLMDDEARARYFELRKQEDPDRREASMQKESWYPHLRTSLYPRTRTVSFDFHLHRKGMVKDTVMTTEIDSTYMAGVRALGDRDYETAVLLLRPYRDFNTAVAYCAMDYNASAMDILKDLERKAEVCYLMALLHSRAGEHEEAVNCYLEACRKNESYVHRGNLDPEISMLIKTYSLNQKQYE
ncbi:MAG: hypothetical protein HUJ94_03480 [Bacteroidales bacterium]|nr:hypothetical protein [Bacteroidales bacterium]